MIDERHQELASLYALDLLEGAERVQFETELARNAELQQYVADLRNAASALAHVSPPAAPSPKLKARIMADLDQPKQPEAASPEIVPVRSRARVLPWALAAGFAVATAWLGENLYFERQQAQVTNERLALAEVALKSSRAELQMEQVMSGRMSAEYATLKDGAARELQSARTEIASLQQKLTHDRDLANLKIETLASMLKNSPEAMAVAVWDPQQQEGVFAVDRLPPNTADQRYELWVIDGKPVSAGVFAVGADGRAKVSFKPVSAVATAAKFAVSRERNDGQKSHATPGEVVMISQ